MREVALSLMGARSGATPDRAALEMRSARLFAYGESVEAARPSQQGYWRHPVITDNSLQFSLGYLHLDLVFFERLPLCVPAPLGDG
jgi:hypothetical protein